MLTNPQLRVRFLSRLGALSLITIGLVAGVAAAPATALQGAAPANVAVAAVPSSGWSPPASASYVALGDSFTAGQGAPPYKAGACMQSKYASYPSIAAVFSRLRLVENKACSGATVADVGAQLVGVSASTKFVTLTVGAIDAGSNDVLAACAPDPASQLCAAAIAASTAKLQALGPQLAGLYSTIAATLPEAHVVVMNYPKLFNPGVAPLGDLVNTATDALNAVIQGAVAATGNTRIIHVDVTQEFAGHGIGARLPYISFDQANLLAPANFHPNALGNALGYTRALANDGVLRR
ncbi:MAG: SGNH/GDSL hydrolase family protein [Microterricola sp.]